MSMKTKRKDKTSLPRETRTGGHSKGLDSTASRRGPRDDRNPPSYPPARRPRRCASLGRGSTCLTHHPLQRGNPRRLCPRAQAHRYTARPSYLSDPSTRGPGGRDLDLAKGDVPNTPSVARQDRGPSPAGMFPLLLSTPRRALPLRPRPRPSPIQPALERAHLQTMLLRELSLSQSTGAIARNPLPAFFRSGGRTRRLNPFSHAAACQNPAAHARCARLDAYLTPAGQLQTPPGRRAERASRSFPALPAFEHSRQ